MSEKPNAKWSRFEHYAGVLPKDVEGFLGQIQMTESLEGLHAIETGAHYALKQNAISEDGYDAIALEVQRHALNKMQERTTFIANVGELEKMYGEVQELFGKNSVINKKAIGIINSRINFLKNSRGPA